VLEDVEEASADDPAERYEAADRVEGIGVEVELTEVAPRRQAADQDPDCDRQPVPGDRQWSEMDLGIDADRDHGCLQSLSPRACIAPAIR
jgi:hypothetical protein